MNIFQYARDTAAMICGLPEIIKVCSIDAGKTVVGIAATAASVFTFGKFSTINKFANLTNNAGSILPLAFCGICRVINPSLDNNDLNPMGIITDKLAKPIFAKTIGLSKSESFLNRQLFSRATFAFGGITAIVTRIADLALGLIAATVAIFPCFARVDKVNQFALRQLTSLSLIHDVSSSLRGFVNPQQFTKKTTKAS